MLEVRDMSFGYTPERKILDSVGFESGEGEVVAILGNNGGGQEHAHKVHGQGAHT